MKYDFIHFNRRKRVEVEQKLADLDKLDNDLKEWRRTRVGRQPTTLMFIANARQQLRHMKDAADD